MTIYKSNLHRCNRRFRDSWKSLKGTHLPSPLHSLQRLEKVKNSLWTEWNSSLFIWIAKDSLNWHLGSKQELDQKELNGIILNTWCLKHLQKPAKCLSHSVLSNSLWPHDGSLPGSSVHEILQARILERIAISISREYPQSRNRTLVSCIAGRFFTVWATREVCSSSLFSEFTRWKMGLGRAVFSLIQEAQWLDMSLQSEQDHQEWP